MSTGLPTRMHGSRPPLPKPSRPRAPIRRAKEQGGPQTNRASRTAHHAPMRTRKTQAAQRLRAGSAWEENDLVFCQQNGRPLDPNGHSKAWKKFLAKPGIREGRLHDASHTAATLLPVQGVDQRTVKAIMGWSEVAMTKRYQHVVRELRREAAARMGEFLWGPTTNTA